MDSTAANPTHTYTANGVYNATLQVTDRTGPLGVGLRADPRRQPAARGAAHVDEPTGGTFDFGDTVTYTVTVTDDSAVDCSKVTVAYVLGHETHGHPLSSTAGCTGSITTSIDSGHAGAANLSAVFVASLHRSGGAVGKRPGAPPARRRAAATAAHSVIVVRGRRTPAAPPWTNRFARTSHGAVFLDPGRWRSLPRPVGGLGGLQAFARGQSTRPMRRSNPAGA